MLFKQEEIIVKSIFLKILQKVPDFEIRIPVIGIGCGVLGLAFAKQNIKMGEIAAQLLKSLEYRGYDSTGAIIQDENGNITIRKDVGAPSELVHTLGITKLSGKIFCGQVRWATFGAVTKENSQPHDVKCKIHIYGAHNGNITNANQLKAFLIQEGHKVVSDNDGEILVHTIEHYFDMYLSELAGSVKSRKKEIRKKAMRKAIVKAGKILEGSFAAIVVDPITEMLYAIKSGSSLYVGIGNNESGNDFILASSDLTAVLRHTKILINISEGQFVEYNHKYYQVFAQKDLAIKRKGKPDLIFKAGNKIEVQPVRSKLRVEDTKLNPPFRYFMEQEIYAEVESSQKLITFFKNDNEHGKKIISILTQHNQLSNYQKAVHNILASNRLQEQQKIFYSLISDKSFTNIKNDCLKKIPHLTKLQLYGDSEVSFSKKDFYSDDANIYLDIIEKRLDAKALLLAKILDAISEQNEIKQFNDNVDKFLDIIYNAWTNGASIYTACCGTSFHAAKTGSIFFNEIASVEIIPILPGDFRGQYSKSMRNNDVLIGVSQSGETKDLIDIFNDVESLGKNIKKIAIVNNVNSTLAQEKSDVWLPIKCGPEIAVPATKSYINQITLLYYLAIRTAEMRLKYLDKNSTSKKEIEKLRHQILIRKETLDYIPKLIEETISTTQPQIEYVAEQLFLEPSMHILATKLSAIAQEGALKVRETVLNHTQGGEGAEFKHGPNTILGKNTVFGIWNIESMMKRFNNIIDFVYQEADKDNVVTVEDMEKIIKAISDYIFTQVKPFNLLPHSMRIFNDAMERFDFFGALYRNYPLIYITGPEDRDVRLTISQINTHKIRGTNTFVIAEQNEKLMLNASTSPSEDSDYKWGYIELPKTDDTLLTTFSSIVVLQLLALKMSIKKMKYLNRIKVPCHGVHPDVPKNVSKSITVD